MPGHVITVDNYRTAEDSPQKIPLPPSQYHNINKQKEERTHTASTKILQHAKKRRWSLWYDEKKWEEERLTKKILENARNEAFLIARKVTEECDLIQQNASSGIKKSNQHTHEGVQKIQLKSQDERKKYLEKCHENAYQKGFNEGKVDGKKQNKALAHWIYNILSSSISKRQGIIQEAHNALVELSIISSRRAILSITEKTPRVIYDNLVALLKNLQGRSNLVITVNGQDLELVSQHRTELLSVVDGVESFQLREDNSLDPGGCMIKADFSTVDATIQTQLAVVEKAIRLFLKENTTLSHTLIRNTKHA